ncbi:MAG: ATP-binding cassette domain-containing protein [Bdellovibrionaceae bacterium]|nr:ATP-binding cassette domain-containing protein [Pseudobdellovibrionaceae bacterium]
MNGHSILKNVDLDVAPGEFVAIVGEVGAGKSMLLLSLIQETGASFRRYTLFGREASSMSEEEFRQHFAYMPQEGFVMSGTLRQNVALDYEISQDFDRTILSSLRLSQFELEKERLHDGLNTEIGERGINLSGGQRQRVNLSRVNFNSRPILLLDDVLSALDKDTETQVMNNLLTGAWKDRTRILVTHRLSVLRHVDRILFMRDGRIVDQGNFEELFRRNQEFRQFSQSLVEEKPPSPSLISEVSLGEK